MTERRDTHVLARAIRRSSVLMTANGRASHVASNLSVADILAVLYGGVLRVDPRTPTAPARDRLIFSKGHAAASLYAALAHTGFFAAGELENFCVDGSPLGGHVTIDVPGVEFSTGSLGHGLAVGVGLALAARQNGASWRVFVVLSDGECDEGAVWEAALLASHHRLGQLCVVVDSNGMQALGPVRDVVALEPFAAKWRAFGWRVVEADGHDHDALADALADVGPACERPRCVIGRTVKGKGVPFMENELRWHYVSPVDPHLRPALAALDDAERAG